MSVEQIEATIESMSASERQKFARWFDEHRHELIGDSGAVTDDLTAAQKTELLRRRQEYDEHPERFVRLDEKGIDEMCERINREVQNRLSSAR
jgi:hypothetical protein